VTRGALNTRASEHEVDATADADKRTEVEELIYLELPLIKLLYAVLTGTLYGDSATLPDHWHLGIPAAFIATSSFTDIGTDWWDTADDTLGFPARFLGLDKTTGKLFYEKELLLLIGAFLRVQADGQLALLRMNRILAGSPYVAVLDASNIVSYSELTHDMPAVHNQFRIDWNWDAREEKLTRTYLLTDQSSISKHGAADVLTMKFRGMDGSNHTQANIATRTDSARDRHAGPPQLATVTCLHSMNRLEVGDIVYYNMEGVQDFVTGEEIARSMEVQQVSMNWMTGDVVLTLFGSSQAASAQSYTELTTVLADAFYGSGSGGTDISTELAAYGSDTGGVWHITSDCSLTGDADMNAAGAIFYYEGGIEVDSSITLTISDNVQIRARDGFTCNGSIDGIGGGLAATAAGAKGMFNTQATGGLASYTGSGAGLVDVLAFQSTEGPFVQGDQLLYYTLVPGATAIGGLPSDLRGSSGGTGGDVDSLTTLIPSVSGGVGGAGGAGLCVIARGFSCGASATIALDGVEGPAGSVSVVAAAGSGAGGAPGALLVLLDGDTATESGIAVSFSALSGALNDIGIPAGDVVWQLQESTHSYYEGFAQQNLGQAAYRVQYIPEDETPAEDVDEITSIPTGIAIQEATAVNNTMNTVVLEISVTAPSDGNYRGSMLYIKKDGTSSWQQIGEAVGAEEVIFYVPGDGSTYNFKAHPVSIFGVESDEFYGPVSHTVATTQVAVIGTNNALATDADVATNGGVQVDTNGIDAFDTGGDQTFDLNAATGRLTAGNTTTERYIDFDPSTGEFEFGRDTRLKGTDAYNNNSIYLHDSGISLDGYITAATGTNSSVTQTGGQYILKTDTAGGDFSRLYKQLYRPINTATWDKERSLKIRLFFGADMTNFSAHILSGQLNFRQIGFKFINNNLYGVHNDGTTEYLTAAIATGISSTEYLLEAVYAPATNIKFYVNGTLQATTTATGLPSGITSAKFMFDASLYENGSPAASQTVAFGEYIVWQEG